MIIYVGSCSPDIFSPPTLARCVTDSPSHYFLRGNHRWVSTPLLKVITVDGSVHHYSRYEPLMGQHTTTQGRNHRWVSTPQLKVETIVGQHTTTQGRNHSWSAHYYSR